MLTFVCQILYFFIIFSASNPSFGWWIRYCIECIMSVCHLISRLTFMRVCVWLSSCVSSCTGTGWGGDDGLWSGSLSGCVCIWTHVLLGGRRGWTARDVTGSNAQQSQTKARSHSIDISTKATWMEKYLNGQNTINLEKKCTLKGVFSVVLPLIVSLTRSVVPIPLPVPVIQVACGNSHSLALTKGKHIFQHVYIKQCQL